MGTVPIIEYGKLRKPSKRSAVIWLLTLAVAGLLVWWFHDSISSRIVEAYADRQYDRAFIAAWDAAEGDEGLWRPSPTGPDGDNLLFSLIDAMPQASWARYQPAFVHVLFIKREQTPETQWLVFGCISQYGLDVLAFDRNTRKHASHRSAVGISPLLRSAVSSMSEPKLSIQRVDTVGDAIRTVITLGGARNEIDWTIVPGAVGFDARPDPLTGWQEGSNWWPDCGNLTLLNGAPASRRHAAPEDVRRVCLRPDGRVVLATSEEVVEMTRSGTALLRVPIPPGGPWPSWAEFAPGGELFAIARPNESVCWVDVRKRQYGGTRPLTGPIHGSFLDERTLVAADRHRLFQIRADADTHTVSRTPGRLILVPGNGSSVTDTPHPDAMTLILARENPNLVAGAGTLVAYTLHQDPTIQLINRSGTSVGSLPGDEGTEQISLSPDARWLAVKGRRGLRVYDVSDGQVALEYNIDYDWGDFGSSIKWSKDGTRGAATGSHFVYVWSLTPRRWLARFPRQYDGTPNRGAGPRPDVALSEDGRSMVACAASSKVLVIWDDIDAALGDSLPAVVTTQPASSPSSAPTTEPQDDPAAEMGDVIR